MAFVSKATNVITVQPTIAWQCFYCLKGRDLMGRSHITMLSTYPPNIAIFEWT